MNSPQRLLVLDGMRGAAAATVLVHHAAPIALGHALLPRGYLGVDFFFMLSGFVMARTYEPRLADGLGARAFLTARVRRLYPVMAIGIVLGALAVIAGAGFSPAIFAMLATELLFIPTLGGGVTGIFFFDGVQWSLFFELFANAVHGSVLHRTPVRMVIWIAAVALIGLALISSRWGGTDVGDREITFLGGVPRVLFSYGVGVVLARRARLSSSAGSAGVPLVLLVAVIAGVGLTPDAWPRWIVDLLATALAFPALILLGARAEASPASARWMTAAGAISYPLYAAHLPAMSLALALGGGLTAPGPGRFAICLAAAVVAATGVQALVGLRFRPTRTGDQAISRASSPPSRAPSTPSTSAA